MHSAVLERKGGVISVAVACSCHGTVRCFTTVKFTLITEALSYCIISLSHHLSVSLCPVTKALMLILAKSMLLTGNKELAPSC